MIRKQLFEELPEVGEIELELDFNYSFTPSKLDGKPEDCYPEDEAAEVELYGEWQIEVLKAYAKKAREAINEIEAKVAAYTASVIREWAAEE